ncbi:unnamed protein product [Urochloa humidicola]
MASLKQSIKFQEGATLIFGSWVCVTDGTGGFQCHLKPAMEKKVATSSIDDVAENLSGIQLSDIVRGHEYEFGSASTSTQARIGLLKLDSTPLSSLKTHPTQPMFGLHNSTTVYQEALRC